MSTATKTQPDTDFMVRTTDVTEESEEFTTGYLFGFDEGQRARPFEPEWYVGRGAAFLCGYSEGHADGAEHYANEIAEVA